MIVLSDSTGENAIMNSFQARKVNLVWIKYGKPIREAFENIALRVSVYKPRLPAPARQSDRPTYAYRASADALARAAEVKPFAPNSKA